jgi:hypothetical protein
MFSDQQLQNARQGKYQDAIAVLLEPDVWRGLSLNDYSQWASQIWHIIVLRASRRLSDFYASLDHSKLSRIHAAVSCGSTTIF